MKPAKLHDFELPIAIEPDNPASVPPLSNHADRATCDLIEGYFMGRIDPAAPLTDAERAEALAIARASIDANIDVVASFAGTVEAAAEEAKRYLSTYTLPAAASALIHKETFATK